MLGSELNLFLRCIFKFSKPSTSYCINGNHFQVHSAEWTNSLNFYRILKGCIMSSLQKQLAAIAAESSNQIDLKAQRVAHSKSLLFEAQSARDQDFYTLFQICYDGYAELCALDHRFISFRTTLFNEQSINTERLQFTLEEAADLNKTLENFMSLIGGRLLLRPAIKAIEWLIRRFRFVE